MRARKCAATNQRAATKWSCGCCYANFAVAAAAGVAVVLVVAFLVALAAAGISLR